MIDDAPKVDPAMFTYAARMQEIAESVTGAPDVRWPERVPGSSRFGRWVAVDYGQRDTPSICIVETDENGAITSITPFEETNGKL